MNKSKTETMILNYLGKPDNSLKNICNTDSIDIQNFLKFKYLGIIFRPFNPNVTDEEIIYRKTAAEIRVGFVAFFPITT